MRLQVITLEDGLRVAISDEERGASAYEGNTAMRSPSRRSRLHRKSANGRLRARTTIHVDVARCIRAVAYLLLAIATVVAASNPAAFFDPADPIDFLRFFQAKLLGESVVVAIDH